MGDFERVEAALTYLESRFSGRPTLAETARAAGLSEFHFQRVFSRWAGVSPKRFLTYLTAEHAKARLRESRSVLDGALEAGLSGPGRLHDLLVTVEAMTPGEYRAGGAGLTIEYGVHPTPFGECLIARTARGVCGLSFLAGRTREEALGELREEWPRAKLVRAREATRELAGRIFSSRSSGQLRLHVKGTGFQLKVWEALLRIPEGALVSYGDLARAIGAPRAQRAVGTAVGANPIAFLIPCHRVIRESGVIGRYRWGTARKRALIGREGVRTHA